MRGRHATDASTHPPGRDRNLRRSCRGLDAGQRPGRAGAGARPVDAPSADRTVTATAQALPPAVALQKLPGSYSQPLYVAAPPGDTPPALRRREDRTHPRHQGRPAALATLPRPVHDRLPRRRAGPALHGLRARLRQVASLLRELHEPRRRHARRALPHLVHEPRPRQHGVAPRHPQGRPAVQQSQRWPAAVRSRRAAVRRDGRRRQRRRSPEPGPEREFAPGQDAAHPAGRHAQCRDLRERPAQPLALLVRPRDRRPLDRRRRAERVGGDRRAARRARARRQPRLAGLRGHARLRRRHGSQPRPHEAGVAGQRVQSRRRRVGDRRLRLPGLGDPRPARLVHLRGLHDRARLGARSGARATGPRSRASTPRWATCRRSARTGRASSTWCRSAGRSSRSCRRPERRPVPPLRRRRPVHSGRHASRNQLT